STSTLLRTIEYIYDDAGNRTSRTVDMAAEEYEIDTISGYKLTATGGADGVVGTGQDDANYGYDTAGGGRLVSIERGNDDWTLNYNATGQIKGISRDGDSTLSYEYDAFGRRTSASVGTTTREYLVGPATQQ